MCTDWILNPSGGSHATAGSSIAPADTHVGIITEERGPRAGPLRSIPRTRAGGPRPVYTRPMLERAFSAAFRNFSTLFLMVALFTVPLHVGYSYVFRDVIEVAELHSSIEEFPDYRQVKGVGPDELRDARLAYLGLSALELALLLPLLARATGRVLEVDARGGVPTIPDAVRSVVRRGRGSARTLLGALPTVAAAALLALVIGWLFERAGLHLAEAVPDQAAWTLVGLIQGTARALAAPFLLVTIAPVPTSAKEVPPGTPTQ